MERYIDEVMLINISFPATHFDYAFLKFLSCLRRGGFYH